MLESNKDFNISLEDTPDCYKDRNTGELLNLENPTRPEAAKVCDDGNTYNRPPIGMQMQYPNCNLASAYEAWRGLKIQNHYLPLLIQAYEAHQQALANYPQRLEAINAENQALRAQLKPLLVAEAEAARQKQRQIAKAEEPALNIINRDVLLTTVMASIKRFIEDYNAGQLNRQNSGRNIKRAEALLKDLTKALTLEDVCKTLSVHLDSAKYWFKPTLKTKSLDTYILIDLERANLLELLLADVGNIEVLTTTENQRTTVRDALSKRLKHDYSLEPLKNPDPDENLDEDELEIIMPIEYELGDSVHVPVAGDVKEACRDEGEEDYNIDDADTNKIFHGLVNDEPFFEDGERLDLVWNDGVTYHEDETQLLLIAAQKEGKGLCGTSRENLRQFKSPQEKTIYIPADMDEPLWVRNNALFAAQESYIAEQKRNLYLRRIIAAYEPQLELDLAMAYMLDAKVQLTIEDLQAETREIDSYIMKVEEQNYEMRQQIQKKNDALSAGLQEEHVGHDDFNARDIKKPVTCQQLVMIACQAVAKYKARVELSSHVDFNQAKQKPPTGFGVVRAEDLVKNLLRCNTLKESLKALYRHLQQKSSGGHKIRLNPASFDSYLLVEFKEQGILERFTPAGNNDDISLRSTEERQMLKDILLEHINPKNNQECLEKLKGNELPAEHINDHAAKVF